MLYAFIALAVFSPLIHIYAGKHPKKKEIFIDLYFKYFLFWIVGVLSIINFMGHTFLADKIAESIGWQSGSPFQFEVAVANLGFGIGGLIALRQKLNFSLGVIICWGVFLTAPGIGHVYQIAVHQNYAENNAGTILFTDFIFPVAGLVLYWLKSKFADDNQFVNS